MNTATKPVLSITRMSAAGRKTSYVLWNLATRTVVSEVVAGHTGGVHWFQK